MKSNESTIKATHPAVQGGGVFRNGNMRGTLGKENSRLRSRPPSFLPAILCGGLARLRRGLFAVFFGRLGADPTCCFHVLSYSTQERTAPKCRAASC